MITRAQAYKIARLVLGVCVSAVLVYFLYSERSPPGASALITLAVAVFFILRRRSGAFDKDPMFRRAVIASSRRPMRDFGLAVACFIATLGSTVAISVAVKHNVMPDNYVTAGILIVLIVAGIGGMLFFMSGVIARVFFGPRPP